MHRFFCLIIMTAVWAAGLAPVCAQAQAYCALRDPVRQIYSICPEAQSYRSIVRTVGDTAREQVTDRVPYPLHFTELGQHTLYIGVDGRRPVGLIQARSERSRRGLVEVVWAFDLDMRVMDFTLQRCRARGDARNAVEGEAFKELIIGSSFEQLVGLLSPDGQTLTPKAEAVIREHPALAAVIVRCGIKTLAAVEAVWDEDVTAARDWHAVLGFFPAAERLVAVADPYGTEVLSRLAAYGLSDRSAIEREQVRMLIAQDQDGTGLGAVVQTDCRFGDQTFTFCWGVDAAGRLREGVCRSGELDEQTVEALDQITGYSLDEIDRDASCAGPMALVATEVLVSVMPYLPQE